MSKASALAEVRYTIHAEGGFVNDPVDPGGMTYRGITAKTLASWKHLPPRSITKASMLAMSMAEIEQLYLDHVYRPLFLEEVPAGLSYVIFDEAVNSGNARAVKALQSLLGIKADGVIGLGTLRAVRAIHDVPAFIRRYDAERISFLRKLKTWWRFGAGWKNRVDLVTSRAVLIYKAYPA